ncbi:MAG: carbohydrate ABC transporter permease [Clostridiaceae bacterium]|jgi:multiple sugar transport system permease protein|nr:carbohydrate ABC transporter permease [Clostridiaceae bacterium]
MKKERKWARPVLYAILIIYALVTLYPFLWAVSASFKTFREITGGGASIIPKQPTLANYINIFTGTAKFTRWFMNSVIIAVLGTLLNVILNSMGGYALAQIEFKGSKLFFGMLMATLTIPGQVLLIPNYLIIKAIGLMNSFSALIVPSAINVTYIFLMRQYFMSFSKQVEEAARIDGVSKAGCFFRIALPLSRSILATQATFIFLGFWNDFTKAMLYLKDINKFTLPVGIQATQSQTSGVTLWNETLTYSVISMVPILIMYIVLNKYFMQGLRMEGEK